MTTRPTSDVAIDVVGLSKRYLVGHQLDRADHFRTLRDVLARNASAFTRKAADMMRGRQIIDGDAVEEFWALQDVSFTLAQGEVVGVIGRNGAGKSTLLKILSRITDPTRGRVTIEGRVSSLLEVGTGFHPELSGRENIFLNGAILGMTKAAIKARFESIVEFAEINRFLDTPVKRYSSGMYVRLAFAVAAHLEPEILIVDEVLAVGDAEFQRKCLGKMRTVASEGRTVLFVSHNLQAVERLCSRGIVLGGGRKLYDGGVAEACQFYLSTAAAETDGALEKIPRQGDGTARICRVDVLTEHGEPSRSIPAGRRFKVRIEYEAEAPIDGVTFGFALLTASGGRVFNTVSSDQVADAANIQGRGVVEVELLAPSLAIGRYLCNLSIANKRGDYCDYIIELPLLEVSDSPALPRTRVYDQGSGPVFPDVRWGLPRGLPMSITGA